MYDKFLEGLGENARLCAIVDMCKDDSGYADIDDVMALASSTGDAVDLPMLELIVNENNEGLEKQNSFEEPSFPSIFDEDSFDTSDDTSGDIWGFSDDT